MGEGLSPADLANVFIVPDDQHELSVDQGCHGHEQRGRGVIDILFEQFEVGLISDHVRVVVCHLNVFRISRILGNVQEDGPRDIVVIQVLAGQPV